MQAQESSCQNKVDSELERTSGERESVFGMAKTFAFWPAVSCLWHALSSWSFYCRIVSLSSCIVLVSVCACMCVFVNVLTSVEFVLYLQCTLFSLLLLMAICLLPAQSL